jgi:hypothetical protein
MHRQIIFTYEIFFLLISVIVVIFVDTKVLPRNHTALLFPPQDLKYFALGYNEVLADALWIRSLQDIDLCSEATTIKTNDSAKVFKPATEVLKEKSTKDVLVDPNISAKCQNGWSARMMDAVTELAPKFKMPYLVGGTILSIVVRDNQGAAKIFKKGVERFPNDWTMSYRAAYHFMAALADYKTASELLIQSGKHGAPAWVFALAARLQTRTGQAILAKPVLEEAIAADPDSIWAQHLKDRLKEVNQIIEKGE